MIKNEVVSPYWRYGCMVAAPLLNNEIQSDFMIQPTETRVDSHRVYRFVFGGMSWAFFVANHAHAKKLEVKSFDEGSEWRFLKTKLSDMKYAENAFKKMSDYQAS